MCIRDSHRTHLIAGLKPTASQVEIARAARSAANFLRRQEDMTSIAHLFEEAGPHGHGAFGLRDTLAALDDGRALHLYMSSTFVERWPSDAEHAARSALDHGTTVDVMSGGAASLFDAKCGGIAAVLRYVREGWSADQWKGGALEHRHEEVNDVRARNGTQYVPELVGAGAE